MVTSLRRNFAMRLEKGRPPGPDYFPPNKYKNIHKEGGGRRLCEREMRGYNIYVHCCTLILRRKPKESPQRKK